MCSDSPLPSFNDTVCPWSKSISLEKWVLLNKHDESSHSIRNNALLFMYEFLYMILPRAYRRILHAKNGFIVESLCMAGFTRSIRLAVIALTSETKIAIWCCAVRKSLGEIDDDIEKEREEKRLMKMTRWFQSNEWRRRDRETARNRPRRRRRHRIYGNVLIVFTHNLFGHLGIETVAKCACTAVCWVTSCSRNDFR